jgi:RHS repeat-associated protein
MVWNDGYTPQVRTTYDAASRVTQIWNWDATIDNTYFDDNALASQREITGDYGDNTPRTVSYTYDGDGNRATMTYYYAGITYNYHYTSRNQLKDINYQSYPPMITYQYDKAGNRTVRAMYNGTTTDYAPVDALNRSSWVRHTFAGGQTARFDYAFDEMSRLKYEQRNSGTADGYSYDPAGEVVNTIRDGTLSNGAVTGTNLPLSYDGAGNRTSTWGISYSVNNLNQYTNAGNTAVTSDSNGNIQSREGWTYTYDAQNRLRRATNGTVFLDFYYDGLNRQITRGVQPGSGWQVTFSVWDGWNLLEEHGLGDVLQRIYFYGGKTDELACAFGGTQPNSWVVQDGRGNVSHIFNDSNNLVERYTYGLAGEPQIWDGSGNSRSESAVENRFLFQGRDYLKEGAIYDYRNRFYLPSLGRFIQPDPIGFKGDSGNLYRYCGNDAVDRSDPTGLISEWQRQMLWQGGGDGTVSEQLTLMYQQQQAPSQVGRSGIDSAGREWRGLTKNEVKLGHAEFGNAVDLDPVTLVHGRYLPTDRTHTIRDRIFFPNRYPRDFARLPAARNSVLIHELTHVWQYQTRFSGPTGGMRMGAARASNPSYHYLPFKGSSFSSYGVEQQAQMQEDAYLLSRGAPVTDTTRASGHAIPSLSEYEALIPFH